MSDSPPAKRARLDTDDSTAPAEVAAAPAPAPAAPAPTPAPARNSFEIELETETADSLFGTIRSTLGKVAATEPQVGITHFVGNDIPPFTGIIKHRFTDFLVYEIGLDGEPVRLKSLDGPTQPKPAAPAPVAEASSENKELWNESSAALVAPLIGPAKLAAFEHFIKAGRPPKTQRGEKPETREFVTDVIDAKDDRTALHKALREAFPDQLASASAPQEDGKQAIKIEWVKPGGQQRQNRADQHLQDRHLPPYIHFTLHKSNKEMHDALSGLCRTLNLMPRDLGTAGTKDKRAVSVQRVSMKRGNKTLDDVWRASRGQGGGRGGRGRGRGRGGWGGGSGPERGVRIGDLAYSDLMLDLGMSKGNKFVVTLRDVRSPEPTTIPRAIETLKTGGFINYYGMQRFGTAPIPTHAIGLALLRSEWALAAWLILREREGEGDDVHQARENFTAGMLDEAVRLMPRRCVAERAILEAYKKHGTSDHLTAMGKIPKNLRMMYVHAYQSYVWNRAVSARIELFGCRDVVEGDLILEGDGEPAEEDAGAESASAPRGRAKEDFSLEPILDGDDEVSLSAPVADPAARTEVAAAIASSKVAKVHVVTAEDVAAKRFSIFDVVLPLPGFAITYPTGKVGACYKDIMRADRLDPDDMYRKQKEYSLGGAYRKILHHPSHVEARQLLYTSSQADLAQSDEDALLGRPKPDAQEYDGVGPVPEGASVALQIELRLGSSTYATMAMREVLKTRTSSADQTERTKEMEEREREFQRKVEEGKEAGVVGVGAREVLEGKVSAEAVEALPEEVVMEVDALKQAEAEVAAN